MSLNNNITLSVSDVDLNTIDVLDCSDVNTNISVGTLSGTPATLVTSINNGWTYSSPFSNMDDNCFVLGAEDNSGGTDIYVVEKWQSHKPIDMGDGLYTSFKEDLLTSTEIKELIYNKLEDQHPEKAIKVGLNKDLTVRKYSIQIEIKMKEN